MKHNFNMIVTEISAQQGGRAMQNEPEIFIVPILPEQHTNQ